MIIEANRVELIRRHFFEFSSEADDSEEDSIPDFEVFKTLSAAEQYFLAAEYNWDDGAIVLNWIIDSPKCDKGTAIMIFWMAEPDYYFDYSEETVDEWSQDVWNLLQKIVVKMKKDDFETADFGFNPTESGYQTDWESAKGIWELPQDLITGTKGIVPLPIG